MRLRRAYGVAAVGIGLGVSDTALTLLGYENPYIGGTLLGAAVVLIVFGVILMLPVSIGHRTVSAPVLWLPPVRIVRQQPRIETRQDVIVKTALAIGLLVAVALLSVGFRLSPPNVFWRAGVWVSLILFFVVTYILWPPQWPSKKR